MKLNTESRHPRLANISHLLQEASCMHSEANPHRKHKNHLICSVSIEFLFTMVRGNDKNLVYDVRLSSVGPSRVTGTGVVYEPCGVDLAMKLHYLKGVYFFSSEASKEISVKRIKEALFFWLNDYYVICGRFRRCEDTGRPYIKCNDCGVRIVEANCDKTVDEWLDTNDCSLDKLLVYHLPIGPELFFSPTLYVQITKFSCGGMALGLSWAHVLGDIFSLSDSINEWGLFLARLKTYGPLKLRDSLPHSLKGQSLYANEPLSLKRVDPVGDHWTTADNCKMETFAFRLTARQLSHLKSKTWDRDNVDHVPFFESLCAILWQCIAKAKDRPEPTTVTLCKKNPKTPRDGFLLNSQIISSVTADFSVVDSDLGKLAMLLADEAVVENTQIEETVERDNGLSDYVMYGSNLTFVDAEDVNLYGLEFDGHRPLRVHYSIQGVGSEGVVLVIPSDNNSERMVMVTLPEEVVGELKFELQKNGLLVDSEIQ